MFNPVNDVENLPYNAQNIIKIYRGMNMVNVSIGEYTSEPSEVYITTSREGDKLSTFIVFYLVNPASQAIYAFEGNAFPQEERIAVELEAKEFVEEMGAILEDIGWEGMPEDERTLWLESQYLFHGEAGKQQDEVVELTEDAIMDETVDEDLEILDDTVAPEDVLDQIASEDQPEDSDDIADDETQAVFIEEKFDELLKKAFLKPKDTTEEIEEEAVDVEPEDKEPVEEPVIEEDLEVKAVTETRVLDRKELAEGVLDEDREKVLRFLSKI